MRTRIQWNVTWINFKLTAYLLGPWVNILEICCVMILKPGNLWFIVTFLSQQDHSLAPSKFLNISNMASQFIIQNSVTVEFILFFGGKITDYIVQYWLLCVSLIWFEVDISIVIGSAIWHLASTQQHTKN